MSPLLLCCVRCVRSIGRSDVYCQYRVYLESALLASDQFSEIDELINRQHILQQTHDDLTAQAQMVSITRTHTHTHTDTHTHTHTHTQGHTQPAYLAWRLDQEA